MIYVIWERFIFPVDDGTRTIYIQIEAEKNNHNVEYIKNMVSRHQFLNAHNIHPRSNQQARKNSSGCFQLRSLE